MTRAARYCATTPRSAVAPDEECATIREAFQFPASITSVVDAPRRVSSDASPHTEWAVTRASTPAARAAAWNRSPTTCGESGTTWAHAVHAFDGASPLLELGEVAGERLVLERPAGRARRRDGAERPITPGGCSG